MAWVNLFDNEETQVGYANVVGTGASPDSYHNYNYPNRYAPVSAPELPLLGTQYVIERGREDDFIIPSGLDGDGVSSASFIREDGVAKVATFGESEYFIPANMILIVPAGGLVGRRFRFRVEGYSQYDAYSRGFLAQVRRFDYSRPGEVDYITTVPDVYCDVSLFSEADTSFSSSFEEIPAFFEVSPDHADGLEPTMPVCPFLCFALGTWPPENAAAWEAKFEVQVWVDDPPQPGSVRPWWLCVPKDPPEPCPVRPTTFVDFANYDPDFKFPLQSSRKPSRIVRPDGCVVCAPTLVEQIEPDPEPEGNIDGTD